MCCVSVGSQKLQAHWQAEQTKRQRVLSFRQAQARAKRENWVLVCGDINLLLFLTV